MEADKKSVGVRIKRIRQEKGLSMEQFGALIDSPAVKSGIISRWETGVSLPNAKRLKNIADLGNTTVEELLHGQKISSQQVRSMLMHGVLEQPLKTRLAFFVEESIEDYEKGWILDFDKVLYFRKLLGRLNIYIPIDETNDLFYQTKKKQDNTISNLVSMIQEDLKQHLQNAGDEENSPLFSMITTFLNKEDEVLNIFLDYIITLGENLAKQDPTALSFVITNKIGALIDGLNSFLKKQDYDGVAIQQYGAYIDPSILIETMDYQTYKEMQRQLVDVIKFVDDRFKRGI